MLVVGRVSTFELHIIGNVVEEVFCNVNSIWVSSTFDRLVEQRFQNRCRPRHVDEFKSHQVTPLPCSCIPTLRPKEVLLCFDEGPGDVVGAGICAFLLWVSVVA